MFEVMGTLPVSVHEQALALLDANWREGEQDGVPYGFSVPSPSTYPWQWYWDSCMHAIVRARTQPDRARTELQTLLAASRDGFIGHTVFWGQRLHRRKCFRYNVIGRGDRATGTIQPPMLAWAWRTAVGEPAENPAIAEHHRWLRDHRALEDDGLLWLLQPDESGMDASPKFDHVWGPYAQGTPLFPALVARNRKLGFDIRRVAGRRTPARVRGAHKRHVVAVRAGARAPVADARPDRPLLRPRARTVPRRRAQPLPRVRAGSTCR